MLPSFVVAAAAPATRSEAALPQRAAVVVGVLAVWVIVIAARLVQLQVAQYDSLHARARGQQQSTQQFASSRGLILDRAGRELARSVNAESIFAVPAELSDLEATATLIAPVIGTIDAATLLERLRTAKNHNRQFAWIARRLAPEQAEQIKQFKIKGIHTLAEPKRRYPNGRLAAHILGFVGLDQTGLSGTEQFHNVALRGEPGQFYLEKDARRRAYESFEVATRAGESLVLTIDSRIQHYTEQRLAAAVKRARARSGTVVVLDPRTGEILALANAPSFDPNNATKIAPEARTNEALQNIYEPGSTFKIVAYAAALEENLVQPTGSLDCQMGAINVNGRIIRDHHPYGRLTLTEAMAKSSNVAAIKLGLLVGDARMYDYITRFGFGRRTGVELPGETAGLVRPVQRWQRTSIGSIAIGQEIGVTPVQMAAAFATIANNGVRVAPHLVREVRRSDGTLVRRATPKQQRVISQRTAEALRPMLESVTLKGTAQQAQLDGYTAAGKTGTAQKIDPQTRAYSPTKHVASFVGFASTENPAVVIAVVLDEPIGAYHGGQVAAPLFREIAETVLPMLEVRPDAEFQNAPVGDLVKQAMQEKRAAELLEQLAQERAVKQATLPVVISPTPAQQHLHQTQQHESQDDNSGEIIYAQARGQSLLMPDLDGQSVRDAWHICARLGLTLEARGDGRAREQMPRPGTAIDVGQIVRVDFSRNKLK